MEELKSKKLKLENQSLHFLASPRRPRNKTERNVYGAIAAAKWKNEKDLGRVRSCRVTQISRAFHSVATKAPLNISLRLTKQTPGTRNIYS